MDACDVVVVDGVLLTPDVLEAAAGTITGSGASSMESSLLLNDSPRTAYGGSGFFVSEDC